MKMTFSISNKKIKTSEFLLLATPVLLSFLLLIFLFIDRYTFKLITPYTALLIIVVNTILCLISWFQLNHLEQKYNFQNKNNDLKESGIGEILFTYINLFKKRKQRRNERQ